MRRAALVLFLVVAGLQLPSAQAPAVEWTHYAGNAASQRILRS
jgi:hypothetical protein